MVRTINSQITKYGFNLSILECKSREAQQGLHKTPVLIYPYWNVNMQMIQQFAQFKNCFNLSILECKLLPRDRARLAGAVLIYPYWNVNHWYRLVVMTPFAGLIYPYWNVNVRGIVVDTASVLF